MAGQTWCVTIVEGTPCTFVPDVYTDPGTPPPTALIASTGDLVSWNNQTKESHDLSVTDAAFKTPGPSITGPIGAGESSKTGYVTAGAAGSPNPTPSAPVTIYYACTDPLHENENGTIVLIA